ncbi:torsin-1A-like [Trichogramma pretiosum]|uniref:torsin-1A-like n=1 Tax=Trichogramma pretiosum TaxID=7493 RepID=UPI0006C9B9B0|nr:torsin-1A-like [Trichogramma pretiosum]
MARFIVVLSCSLLLLLLLHVNDARADFSEVWESATSAASSIASYVEELADATIHSAKDYYCQHSECCGVEDVPYNLNSLRSMLWTKLYGQHIASEVVLNAINSHIKSSDKPLVLSFQGTNGVGKSFVSKMIARAFYKKGEKSKFFHFYYGLENFPIHEKVSEYQVQLKSEVEAAINSCERSLFVFDGVDYMPPGLLNILMPFIDSGNYGGKSNKNKSIFIFMTNRGGLAIQNHLLSKYEDDLDRESTTLQDFEDIIMTITLRQSGGFYESAMIQAEAIDYYVPFLPLEKHHVRNCIHDAYRALNVTPTNDLIEKVFSELRFGPPPQNIFSNSGCKRVEQITGRMVARLQFDKESSSLIDTQTSRYEL